jgi:hypothetical protein
MVPCGIGKLTAFPLQRGLRQFPNFRVAYPSHPSLSTARLCQSSVRSKTAIGPRPNSRLSKIGRPIWDSQIVTLRDGA